MHAVPRNRRSTHNGLLGQSDQVRTTSSFRQVDTFEINWEFPEIRGQSRNQSQRNSIDASKAVTMSNQPEGPTRKDSWVGPEAWPQIGGPKSTREQLVQVYVHE